MNQTVGDADRPLAIDPGEIRTLLTMVSRPRMTGAGGSAEVESRIRDRFDILGYNARELPFTFSTLPGRFGLPIAGVVAVATGVAAMMFMGRRQPLATLVALLIGLALAALPLLALERGLRLPWLQVKTANLLFTRDSPRWIIMAHRDTKSQGAPTLIRSGVLVGALVMWTTLTALATATAAGGPLNIELVWGTAGFLIMAGAALILSPSGNESPGALDNGTGLAALLALARKTPPDVAFLVTDAEELGLAGARAAAGDLPEVEGIINLDGLDDVGPVRIAEGRQGVSRASTDALGKTLVWAARELGLGVVRRPLPPFLMVDHEPLVSAGLPALTVLKGRWRSLLRIHTPSDTADRLTGIGAARVATLILTALTGLSGADHDTLRPDDGSGHSPPL